ncbi:MAG TPA: peptidoglycan DD-metalloendopeptidase family protein [Pseudonocardiaceae bacterium]
MDRPRLIRSRSARVLTAAVAAATLLLAPGTGTAGTSDVPRNDPHADPVPTVTTELLQRARGAADMHTAGAQDTRITVTRSAPGWAFGTAVVVTSQETDHHPYGRLFLAERRGDDWHVAFDGEAAFAELSTRAPVVTSAEERRLFAQQGQATALAGGDYRTGMQLPFAVGASWYMYGGPHGWAGSDTPYSSLDLAGGDQVVRAARAGTAYTMCQGWIRVIHDRGYATDYYHLWNNISANGLSVSAGTRLGDTGTDVTCGGSATGRHVHFALRQNDVYVGIAGHNVGKWVFQNGGAPYQGSALHGSTLVYAGGQLYNYGALGLNQGIVDTNGGGYVNKRSGPGTGYAIVGSVADGETVTVACSANGTSHTGRWGTTSLWNRLSDGTWVSDAYLWTGMNGPVNGWC